MFHCPGSPKPDYQGSEKKQEEDKIFDKIYKTKFSFFSCFYFCGPGNKTFAPWPDCQGHKAFVYDTAQTPIAHNSWRT